jgi:lipopolysaccharide transport system permease protein
VAYLVSVATTLVRDAVPIVTNLLTTAMYLTPVIYPIDAIPQPYRTFMLANPLAAIVISYRRLLLDGTQPPWTLLGLHAVAAVLLLVVARRTFQAQRSSFAEIL